MSNLEKYNYIDEEFYKDIKKVLEEARKRVYRNIQSEMVMAYWQIGKMIVEKQGGVNRAMYGDGLIKELSIQMTTDYGKGYDERNLRSMRQLYLAYPKWNAVRAELSWTHYRLLIKVEDKNARNFYTKEAIENNWSTRQLEREINTFSYQRYLASHGNHDVVDDTAKREKRIPFDISAPDYFSPENAKGVINAIRQEAAINGTSDMSMEEIDKEIAASRKEIRR